MVGREVEQLRHHLREMLLHLLVDVRQDLAPLADERRDHLARLGEVL
jgi:hypothetical protein